MNLADAVKRAPSSESTPRPGGFFFRLMIFRCQILVRSPMPILGLEGQASWGNSCLGVGNQRRKQGTRLWSEVESRLWAWGLPIWIWSSGFDSDDVSLLSDKEVGLHVRKKDFSRNYARGSCKFRRHLSELGVSSSEY